MTRPQERFPAATPALLLSALAATGCGGGGGGGGPVNLAPTLVAASFQGAATSPAAGDFLVLAFSETIALGAGTTFDGDDLLLSAGSIGQAPTTVQTNSRTLRLTFGSGVAFAPGSTTITLSSTNDAVRDLDGATGLPAVPVTIGSSDGAAPTISGVTIESIHPQLNGTGPAGGTLQVPVNGWAIDLQHTDNSGVDPGRTRITANVAVGSPAGTQPPGADLVPFLAVELATPAASRFRVPAGVSFPFGPAILTSVVFDGGGLGSSPVDFDLTVRPFDARLQPFETSAQPRQTWFLDLSRDVESYTVNPVFGGSQMNVVAGANGRPDLEDLFLVIGLHSPMPIPNVVGSANSNAVVLQHWIAELGTRLAALYAGANVEFTFTRPGPAFGSASSVPYQSFGYSQLCIGGSADATGNSGVLGLAIFDPNNETQNDDCRLDFQGARLGVFLQTIVDNEIGPPATAPFRLMFDHFTPTNGGTPIGNNPLDREYLLGNLPNDPRAGWIDAAIATLARFTAVVVAHECGHSVGLVKDGAMPIGLYGGDVVNFPGPVPEAAPGHIQTASHFPNGAINVMSPTLSWSLATNTATAFNTLNIAYLRERVVYGN
jgi:hypothetical protein